MTNTEKARNAKIRAEAIAEVVYMIENEIESYQDKIKYIEEEWRENGTSEEGRKESWRYGDYEHSKIIISAFVEIQNSILKN